MLILPLCYIYNSLCYLSVRATQEIYCLKTTFKHYIIIVASAAKSFTIHIIMAVYRLFSTTRFQWQQMLTVKSMDNNNFLCILPILYRSYVFQVITNLCAWLWTIIWWRLVQFFNISISIIISLEALVQ